MLNLESMGFDTLITVFRQKLMLQRYIKISLRNTVGQQKIIATFGPVKFAENATKKIRRRQREFYMYREVIKVMV
jgi:hypothetical protein